MFDPQTTALIRQAPTLPQLDRERLPEEFTKAFAAIVAFRIQLTGTSSALPDSLREKLDEFRRMAATFETMVVLLPERADRRSAAFVAAQAQQLLHLARQASAPNVRRLHPLRSEAISPEISALLLFLIANQPSDAMEMARIAIKIRPEGDTASSLLIDALNFLASGHLSSMPTLIRRQMLELPEDACEAATESLYYRLLEGIALLSEFLTDARDNTIAGTDAIRIFREVQRFSVQVEPWPFVSSEDDQLPPISTFAGPHQLASLLIAATDLLGESALSGVPVPPGITSSEWKNILKFILAERPFLWPNHLEALSKGFLDSGTSAVVSFPTGAGKTTLSELKAASALARGGAIIYLAPTHALVAQMKSDLANVFPDVPVRESLLVEDFYAEIEEEFGANNAQIVVMTPERCLALLSLGGEEFSAVRLVIFDECHLFHPKSTGHNRRSLDAMLAILHLHSAAPAADWLLLSAMMANADEIAGWLGDLIKRPCLALSLQWKPTRQVRGCLVYDRKEISLLHNGLKEAEYVARNTARVLPNPTSKVKDALQAHPYGFFCLQQTWQSIDMENYALLPLLNQLVPLSVSISPAQDKSGNDRKQSWYITPNKNKVASHIAAQCVRAGMKVLLFGQSTKDVGAIAKAIDILLGCESHLPTFNVTEDNLFIAATQEAGNSNVIITASGCAACHHSLMLPLERELVERLFRRADGIQALAATATLAQGMNLPADIVLIVGDERFEGEIQNFSPLEAHELLNAAGRAGRAGLVAQGVVLVLPHKLVDFDPLHNRISEKWMDLQKSVFSRADQCLSLQDPIRHLIDRVHDATAQNDPDVRYFLRRIPVGLEGDFEAPKRFLLSTLAAWHSKRANEIEKFNQVIEKTLVRRRELTPSTHKETWRDDIAYRTGIDVDFIEALHQELLMCVQTSPLSIAEWVKWYFGWLAINQKWYDVLLGHRLHRDFHEEFEKGDLFGNKLIDIIWGWMSGETLLSLNKRLDSKAKTSNSCLKARKFVLRLVPELAFAAGIVTRVRRKQIEVSDGELSLPLKTLALCIREGVTEPELAAIKVERASRSLSRQALQAEWQKIRPYISSRNEFEGFGKTRRRVIDAYKAWQTTTGEFVE